MSRMNMERIFGSNNPTTLRVESLFGKKILSSELSNDEVILTLESGQKIVIWDDGNKCCERRYITTDDDMESLVGNILSRIDMRGVRYQDEGQNMHEVGFLEIGTDSGFVTLSTHNEHNGAYGDFMVRVAEISCEDGHLGIKSISDGIWNRSLPMSIK